jgi:hypothetical protein
VLFRQNVLLDKVQSFGTASVSPTIGVAACSYEYLVCARAKGGTRENDVRPRNIERKKTQERACVTLDRHTTLQCNVAQPTSRKRESGKDVTRDHPHRYAASNSGRAATTHTRLRRSDRFSPHVAFDGQQTIVVDTAQIV